MINQVRIMCGGYCTHLECMTISTGRCKNVKIPSMFVLITHEQHGHILFDTGYSPRFLQETKSFPFSLYAMMTPVYVHGDETAAGQLKRMGINPEEIKFVIISHFHADHVSGLRDFSNARYVCLSSEYQAIKVLGQSSSFTAVRHAFIPSLLPDDFDQRVLIIDDEGFKTPGGRYVRHLDVKYAPFDVGFDLFQDGSLLIVPLPGHTPGHLGCFVTDKNQERYFMVGDACWHSKSYRGHTAELHDPKGDIIPPSYLTSLIHHNWNSYLATLRAIRTLYIDKVDHKVWGHDNLHIIPSHCPEVYNKYVTDKEHLISKL
jgi:glyoxylase-like metal-dependent hydrolase (beta-lactamase superfamily II)